MEYHKKNCKSLLNLITREDRQRLMERSTSRDYSPGEHIVRFKDVDTNLYLINHGQVRVTLYSSDGKEVSFVDIGAGGNFGEFSAIDGLPRSANVVALTDSTITIVPPDEFKRILEKYPGVCIEMLQQLTAIVRRLCDRIFEYSTLDVTNRIRAELLRLSDEYMDYDGVARIQDPPNQSEMASRVSCTREAVSRELKRLENSGVIARKSGKLIVEDYHALQELLKPGPSV